LFFIDRFYRYFTAFGIFQVVFLWQVIHRYPLLGQGAADDFSSSEFGFLTPASV